MKILVLGATGATGRHLLDQALAKGHEVTALVRESAKISITHPRLVVVSGKPDVAADLERTVRGQDAVLSALGPRRGNDPIVAEVAGVLVPAMHEAGVKRLIWLSAAGVGDSAKQLIAASFVFGRIILPLFLRKPYANHERAETIVRASQLDWTIARPVELVDRPTGRSVTASAPDNRIVGLKIARQDVAAFMLGELESGAQLKRALVIHA
jgi:putative NADH-flavin reductase